MSDKLLRFLAICTLGVAFAISATAAIAQSVIVFDAPGAGTETGQGTLAIGNNFWGTITGFTRDTNWVRHGFLRRGDGTFTILDDPSAGTCSTPCGNSTDGPGTRTWSINDLGVVAGNYTVDSTSGSHGFVLTPDGTFTNFDAPDAGKGPFPQGTFPSYYLPYGINLAGAITGYYIDSNGVQHGFVRAPNGTLTEFDPTGSLYTYPMSIGPTGAITGYYCDDINCHGFLRAPNGTFTTFDVPGDVNGTYPSGLMPHGVIEGYYCDASGNCHGFLRAANGTYTTFDAPGAGTGSGQGTGPNSNNVLGAITGYYVDSNNLNHGFARGLFGNIVEFDAPGGQGTFPYGINLWGTSTGYDLDENGVVHGFLANPFFDDLEPSETLPEASHTINDQRQIVGESATTAAPNENTQRPNITLPENIRRLLQRSGRLIMPQ